MKAVLDRMEGDLPSWSWQVKPCRFRLRSFLTGCRKGTCWLNISKAGSSMSGLPGKGSRKQRSYPVGCGRIEIC